MRSIVFFAAAVALWVGAGRAAQPDTKDGKKDAKTAPTDPGKPTPAADRTRAVALKAKVSGDFSNARLGDILKEFAAQVDTKADVVLFWIYGKGFPYAQRVTYSCKEKPLEAALDELFKTGGLGYIVLSQDGGPRDGWVLLTTTGERGSEKGAEPLPKATAAEEADAVDKLGLAKKLIEANKTEQAKTVLTYVIKKYPGAKATVEAKELLEKLGK